MIIQFKLFSSNSHVSKRLSFEEELSSFILTAFVLIADVVSELVGAMEGMRVGDGESGYVVVRVIMILCG